MVLSNIVAPDYIAGLYTLSASSSPSGVIAHHLLHIQSLIPIHTASWQAACGRDGQLICNSLFHELSGCESFRRQARAVTYQQHRELIAENCAESYRFSLSETTLHNGDYGYCLSIADPQKRVSHHLHIESASEIAPSQLNRLASTMPHALQAWRHACTRLVRELYGEKHIAICSPAGDIVYLDPQVTQFVNWQVGMSVPTALLSTLKPRLVGLYRMQGYDYANLRVLTFSPCASLGEFRESENLLADRLLRGESNKQIALSVGCSEKTVRNRLTQLYKQMGVTGRNQAVASLNRSLLEG
ncbi:helix-turn-helix domain-containing protein [Aliagarivorans marinus]|uniref:helix-turn-helix domain-containing protein n=1 Tax=Aliagarivorans marinus TaxID=561965 RepID=UPI0004287174|nr:helix-turn-helix transcriptional regulator [Aliagarivorans marinus]